MEEYHPMHILKTGSIIRLSGIKYVIKGSHKSGMSLQFTDYDVISETGEVEIIWSEYLNFPYKNPEVIYEPE